MAINMTKPGLKDLVQAAARRGALKLEILGMKRRGQSAYSIVKEVYGFKGDRKQVLAQLDAHIEKLHLLNELRAAYPYKICGKTFHDKDAGELFCTLEEGHFGGCDYAP